MSLEDLNEELGTDFHSDDAETIGGLVLTISGSFPDEGEIFYYEGWTIRVMGLEDHRITLLNLSKKEEPITE